jgi:hypothetical protein
MMDCARLSDRMPEVALGRTQWTPEEADHLATCAGCQREWRLVRLAGSLGEGLGAGPDPASVARVALQRVALERHRDRQRRWSLTGLAAAATIALAVWYGRGQPGQNLPSPARMPVATAPTPRVTELAIPLPELDQLQEPELDSLLQTISPPLTSGSTLAEPSMGDLDDHELEEVLSTWEG